MTNGRINGGAGSEGWWQPLLGHAEQQHRLRRAVERGSLAHALLLAGPEGVGKSRVATALAATLFCEVPAASITATSTAGLGGCGTCEYCRKFRQRLLPDFLEVAVADRDEWNVDAYRQLLSGLQMQPYHGRVRVVLFHNADYMTEQVANTLLKTLEEPRHDTFLILTAASPSRLPRTVLSRSQLWYFGPLSLPDMKEALAQSGKLPETNAQVIDTLSELGEGSPGLALELAVHADLVKEVEQVLSAVLQGNIGRGIEWVRTLPKERDDLRPHVRLIRSVARASLRRGTTPSERYRWALLVANILDAERLIFDRYLNPAAVLIECLNGLSSEAAAREIPLGADLLSSSVI